MRKRTSNSYNVEVSIFARVDGIELSCHIANIVILNFKRLNADCKIFVCDAASFLLYDAYNIIYLYNPFPNSVMFKTIDSLSQSLRRVERDGDYL